MKIVKTSEYKQTSIEETFKLMETSGEGLSDSEVQRRVTIFGLNEVTQKRGNQVLAFLARYWGPMPWLLELAIVLSIVLKHYLEAGIILALLTINTIIGQIQSRGSQRALEALKKRLAIEARVLRNGNWVTIPAKEIVPGDIVSIALGDIVPADAKLISGDLSMDQSILTGESLPVAAQQSAIIYSGSVVSRGEAKCIVVNTGANTYFGKTAELVKTAKPKSHQEQIMLAIVRYMMFLGLGALVLVAVYAAIIGTGILPILTFAVIFLMAAIPVALPAVMTIVQSVGAMELARKGVLVTRLDSIEDAASIDVLCLDKTGTITQNKLSVGDVVPFAEHTKADVIIIASLASQERGKDLIDAAVLDYARTTKTNLDSYEHISFTPFEPSTKRSEAVVATGGKRFKVVKGAPQTVISICKGLDQANTAKVNQTVEELSRKGYRTLGVARSPVDALDNFEFVGLLSLADPPRPDSKAMIENAKTLGVKPVMLTGDNIAIAREIARQVSIGDKIIRMEEFRKMDETEQAKMIEESDGFAEIYPEDKHKIVKLFQSRGHMVGMTGDGVNDAPALKQAEMGIAVSSATDVAKASASIVLTEPGIGVIIDAIKTSRHIYQRMLTWVINKVTKVIQVIGLLAIGFFWFHGTVVSLLGMTLLIFANDFVTMSLATDNVKYTANPNKWNVRKITFASLVIGALFVVEGVAALFVGTHYFHLEWAQLRTFTVLMLIFTSQFRVLIVRERRHFWSSRPGRDLALATTGAIIVFALLGVYGLIITPLTPYQVIFLLGFSALFTVVIDFPKYKTFGKFGLANSGTKPEAKAEQKPEAKADQKPEAKAEQKPEAKADQKPEAKADQKPEAKADQKPEPEVKADQKPEPEVKAEKPADLTPQIARRAFELYETQGHKNGRSVQDWEQAEREIRKDETKVEPQTEARDESDSVSKAEPKSKSKADTETEDHVEPKPESKKELKPEVQTGNTSDLGPRLVKRVHELYEKLGREEVQAVEDWEKAERENGQDEAKSQPKAEPEEELKPEDKGKPKPEDKK